MSSPQQPFYFAWVDETQTVFDPLTMAVVDEEIFSFSIKHDEGQHPTLDLKVRNPRIGLLNPGRKVWGWFSYQKDPSTIVPLFFGVLIGIPTNIYAEIVTFKFIARPSTYIEDKQAVAEAMKIRPYYDPVWVDEKDRDRPDAVLEGWSALWHVDRTSLVTTASDVLVGEDGTIDYTGDKAFYDSVSVNLGQSPLANVRVEASVKWTQRSVGYMPGPSMNVSSYTGETLLSDWPKPGASLGSGWRVAQSFAIDTYAVANTPTVSSSWHWESPVLNPLNCSEKSSNQNVSGPALLSPNPITGQLTGQVVVGVCDPFSDPPINQAASIQSNGVIVPLWSISASMTLRYDAKRQYREDIMFDVIANTQGILTSPNVSQNTELVTVPTADVGAPLVTISAWSDFAGQAVLLGQIIFPNDPTRPGGLSYQIAVQAGTAGADEPLFSDVPGTITDDNTVQWASMGTTPPTETSDWTAAAFVPSGELICFQEEVFDNRMGEFITTGRTSYYICTTAGQTNQHFETMTYTPQPTNSDMPTPAPVTIAFIRRPLFATTFGEIITDGSVRWTVLGTSPNLLSIPIGGTPSSVTARCYFPTDRGLWSVEALICKARARLRMRSRAVTIGFDCRFNDALGLSCRKSATLHDPRLPGGAATGKVMHYELRGGGDGRIDAHVEIGCAVGFDGHAVAETGTPVYASDGYMQHGYQLYEGATTILPENDITYAPPTFVAFDDGLRFPLQLSQVSEGGTTSAFSLAAQAAAIKQGIAVSREIANTSFFHPPVTPNAAWAIEQVQLRLASQALPYVMEANPISWTCYLKPITNGPFNGAYAISVSPLEIPKGIDLEAPSSP